MTRNLADPKTSHRIYYYSKWWLHEKLREFNAQAMYSSEISLDDN